MVNNKYNKCGLVKLCSKRPMLFQRFRTHEQFSVITSFPSL